MGEPRLAKKIAIGLGAAEFLVGLVVSAYLFIAGSWLTADPEFSDALFWPIAYATMLAITLGPLVVAWFAEKSQIPRTVYLCLALLLIYPAMLTIWAKLSEA